MTDGQSPSLSTPAQRAAKAAKMIGYLSKTPEKIAALVQTAQQQGIDPSRVEVVSDPQDVIYVCLLEPSGYATCI